MQPATSMTDRELCDAITGSVAAVAEFQRRFRLRLEADLLGQCQRQDGRSREKAIEIVSQVLAECVSGSPTLLEKWRGQDHLEAFLRTVTRNRLKSWWQSRDAQTEVNSDSGAIQSAASGITGTPGLAEEILTARKALQMGVQRALDECPEGVVFMRLKGLHGVDQRAISSVWGHHEAQTSRRIREAMAVIRTTATEFLTSQGVEADPATLQLALQSDPSILLGNAGSVLSADEVSLLREVAGGSDPQPELRELAVKLMCGNLRALEFFAGLLSTVSTGPVPLLRDASFDGMAANLTECMRHAAQILKPCEVRKLLTPLMIDGFADSLHALRADGGTLWLCSPGEAVLEAVFNPLEPEIIGKRQPLVSGIVSLVMATSESIRVDEVSHHRDYSPAVDSALGRSTRSMLAVPFRWMNSTRGVLTAVRFDAGPFQDQETKKLERHAQLLELQLCHELQAGILGKP